MLCFILNDTHYMYNAIVGAFCEWCRLWFNIRWS